RSGGGRRFPVKCANGLLCDPKNSFNCAVAGLRYVRRSFANVLLIDQPGHSTKLPTIGFLGGSTASALTDWTAAFVQRLRELGWIEGRTIAIEYRSAEGRDERFDEIAAEVVRLKVDVIVTQSTPAVLAAKQVTSVIPIAFGSARDPVGTGVVASLARPGGNITGLSGQATDTAARAGQWRMVARHPALLNQTIAFNTNSDTSTIPAPRERVPF